MFATFEGGNPGVTSVATQRTFGFVVTSVTTHHPPHHDRLGVLVQDDARRHLRGRLVVGSVHGHRADGILWLLRTRSKVDVAFVPVSEAAMLVLLAAAAGTRIVAGNFLAGLLATATEGEGVLFRQRKARASQERGTRSKAAEG